MGTWQRLIQPVVEAPQTGERVPLRITYTLPSQHLSPPLAASQRMSSTAIVLPMPSIPTKYSLQIIEHFPGPRWKTGDMVFVTFVSR